MPSAIAARVADSASSTRCCSSFSSALVGAPDADHRHLAGQRADPLGEHVLVDPEGGPLQLRAQLGEPELDLLGGAGAADDGGLVGVDPDLRGPAELLDRHCLQGEPGVLAVDGAAGDRRDVLQLVQPPVAEPGGAHGDALEDPVDVVVHEHGQRRALDRSQR